MISKDLLDRVVDRLLKEGMPQHCGTCLKLEQCMKESERKICPWIKRSRMILRSGALVVLCVSLVIFSSTAYAARPSKNALPVVVSISPSSGEIPAGNPVVFTSVYSDPDGWQNLKSGELLIGASSKTKGTLRAYYDQNSNRLYLKDDANKKWLGGHAPGSANVIENSNFVLDCSKCAVDGNGAVLSVIWSVIFKPTFAGSHTIYLYVTDDAGASQGWVNMGTCTVVSAPTDSEPPFGSVLINNGAQYTNQTTVELTLSARDNEGGSGVSLMQFSDDNVNWSAPEPYATGKSWIVSALDGPQTVYVKFCDAASNWSRSFSSSVILDTKPPQITIISPPDNQAIEG